MKVYIVTNSCAFIVGVYDTEAQAKAARLCETPCIHFKPRRAASAAKLSARPAARRNQRPKLTTISTQISLPNPKRRRIGANSAGIAPRLSRRT